MAAAWLTIGRGNEFGLLGTRKQVLILTYRRQPGETLYLRYLLMKTCLTTFIETLIVNPRDLYVGTCTKHGNIWMMLDDGSKGG